MENLEEKNDKFAIGEKFDSYIQLKEKIELFKRHNFVDLYVRDSRTVASAVKRLTKSLNPAIHYYELKLACVHGGKKFQPRGKGERRSL